MILKKSALLFLSAAALSASTAHAAVVTWSAATNISGDNDIITTGSTVQAVHFGNATTRTINTVTFTGTTSVLSGWTGNASNMYNSGSIPGVGTEYAAALNDCVYKAGASTTADLTLSGLTAGNTYQFQVWYCDLRVTTSNQMTWGTNPASNTVALNSANTATDFGQFVTGTFTADATSQVFRIQGSAGAGPELNMYQLRLVPEPSAALLGGLGVLALLRRRRN